MLRERKKSITEYKESVTKRNKSSYEIIKNMRINREIVIYWDKNQQAVTIEVREERKAGDGLLKNQ